MHNVSNSPSCCCVVPQLLHDDLAGLPGFLCATSPSPGRARRGIVQRPETPCSTQDPQWLHPPGVRVVSRVLSNLPIRSAGTGRLGHRGTLDPCGGLSGLWQYTSGWSEPPECYRKGRRRSGIQSLVVCAKSVRKHDPVRSEHALAHALAIPLPRIHRVRESLKGHRPVKDIMVREYSSSTPVRNTVSPVGVAISAA